MTLSDDDLLDFDHEQIIHFDVDQARRALAEHGNTYRAQLVAARWLDEWRRRQQRNLRVRRSDDYCKGFDSGLREVIAHLRKGDFLPGATLYESAGASTGGETV